MCCNIFDLGALNVLIILQGVFAVIMNALPVSTDCDMAAEGFFGQVGYHCNQIEKMLNASWINAYISIGLWMIGLGLLPKLSKDVSPAANKLVVMMTCAAISINQIGNLIMVWTIPIAGADPTVMYTFVGMWFVFLAIATFVHKDPTTGAKMF